MNKPAGKRWHKSKTMWINIITGVPAGLVAFLPILDGAMPDSWFKYLLFASSLANMILRKMTVQPIEKTGDR